MFHFKKFKLVIIYVTVFIAVQVFANTDKIENIYDNKHIA